MHKALQQFERNIAAVRELQQLYYYLVEVQKLPNNLSDILRSQLVYAVSAFDKLIHEVVREEMLQSFSGQRIKTDKFKGFAISLETYHQMQQASQSTELLLLLPAAYFFEQEIIAKHKHLAFQDPDKVADALSLIWLEKQKWQKIASLLNKSDDSIKKTLKEIVHRRNQIVHEADINWQTNNRTDINADDIKEAVDFIYQLGKTIIILVTDPINYSI